MISYRLVEKWQVEFNQSKSDVHYGRLYVRGVHGWTLNTIMSSGIFGSKSTDLENSNTSGQSGKGCKCYACLHQSEHCYKIHETLVRPHQNIVLISSLHFTGSTGRLQVLGRQWVLKRYGEALEWVLERYFQEAAWFRACWTNLYCFAQRLERHGRSL